MHRATPLAQDESHSSRSPQQTGITPALVLIRCNSRSPIHHPASRPATAAPACPCARGEHRRGAHATPTAVAARRFVAAAERRRSNLDRFSRAAGRMASQAELLAVTLRTLRFAGSTA